MGEILKVAEETRTNRTASVAVPGGWEARPKPTRLRRTVWRLLPARRFHDILRRANTPPAALALLVVSTLFLRLVFASAFGLGIDESYMVAAGRELHLSYFDHPPLAWWMAWGAAHLFGTDAPWAVRLPFVLTFAGTTWLMFALAARFYGARAGFWAAALLNAAPVLGVTSATWVLPDGPLLAALLGAAICFDRCIAASGNAAWRWWISTGLCTGLALLSKYSAILTITGAAVFLLTEPSARRWLSRPHPYVAGLVALAVFSPVLIWNAQNGWVSMAFQGGRAAATRLHPLGPLSTLGGEALFLLPWMWLPLVLCGALALRRGRGDRRSWLLACLGIPPILFFLVVSLWSHVLFHWAAPGYLMLFPLLGEAVGRLREKSRTVRVSLWATAGVVVSAALLVASEVRFNWMPDVVEDFALGRDPDIDAVDWTSVRDELADRGLLARPNLLLAGTRWFDAGKTDYALQGKARVICLGDDAREYGVLAKHASYSGHDVLILGPRLSLKQIEARFSNEFAYIEELKPILMRHAGRPAMLIPVFMGHHFQQGWVYRLDI